MTHEEELIELLDKEKISEDALRCEYPLSHSLQWQRSAIEATFREFGLQGIVVHAYCAPPVNCFDFSIGPNENPSAYRDIMDKIQIDIKDRIQMPAGKNEIRMLVPTSGQNDCRIEIAPKYRAVVAAGEMFRSTEWCDSCALLPVTGARP